tara:strand:+ start:54 stop:506 length:453 start_codon:yes stop_codon:yes gene_type:complete
MVNYGKGKIYKIVDNTNNNVYFGSTTQTLKKRLKQHKSLDCCSREIIKNGDYDIFLVEDYPCNSKKELLSREGYYMKNNECINKLIAGRTVHEYYYDNKEKIKLQRIGYREKTKEKSREYDKRKIYQRSFGGDERTNNNLTRIDPYLFLN